MRTEGDFGRDYHIEQLPIIKYHKTSLRPPPKLPQKGSQHPEDDDNFMAVTIVFEECSNIKDGCDGCPKMKACDRLQSSLSDRGRDRAVMESEARYFINKFLRLITGG
jgi:hypothetical protein